MHLSTAEKASKQEIRAVFGALLFVLLLAALDQTIVATVLPTIARDLGGLGHLSWIVTAYLLTTTLSSPLYGKLGDLYGRKALLQISIVLFLLGSGLCGLSQNVGQLIAFRALQGIGGGGLMIGTLAVVGDLIAPRERGRYQAFFGAVFSVATVTGPIIGGLFVEQLSWRWIFYINLPVGLAAMLVIALKLRTPRRERRRSIDYLGAVFLSGALSAIVLMASLGGTTLAWRSPEILILGGLGFILGLAFVRAEFNAKEPILPLSLFANETFTLSCGIGSIVGLGLLGSATYLPLYLQVVKGMSPTASGLLLAPITVGIPVTAFLSGHLIARTGRYKIFPVIGTGLTTLGMVAISRLSVEGSLWWALSGAVLIGLGLGLVMQILVMAVQNAVSFADLGTATAGAALFRMMGSCIGVAIFGAIFAHGVSGELGHLLPGAAGLDAHAVLSAGLSDPRAIDAALHPVFLLAAGILALAFILSILLPEIPLKSDSSAVGSSHDDTSVGSEAAHA